MNTTSEAWDRMWNLYSAGMPLQEAFHRVIPDMTKEEAVYLRESERCPSCGHLLALHPHNSACMICSSCTGVKHE